MLTLATLYTIYDVLTSVVGTAAVIAALTPTPKDDLILGKVRKALDLVGANVMHAKNKD